jgi:High potential iron-sulfur protein
MDDSTNDLSRRGFISGVVVLPALAGMLLAQTTAADAKSSKAALKYQNTPNNGKKCSTCTLFIPGSSASANGTCKVVEGSISPHGWCIAYSAKT